MDAEELQTIHKGDNQPDECEVCCNVFNSTRRPRTLPCGHSFCTSCIFNLIHDSRVSCPNCRNKHYATYGMNFPISYGMEALLQKLNSMCLSGTSVSQSPDQGYHQLQGSVRQTELTGTDKLKNLVKEQLDLVEKLPSVYREMVNIIEKRKNRVHTYQCSLKEKLVELETLIQDDLQSLGDPIAETKATIDLLQHRCEILSNLILEGEEKCSRAVTMETSLTSDLTPEKMAITISDADVYITEKDDWLQKCHGVTLHDLIIEDAKKLIAMTCDVVQKALKDDNPNKDNSSTKMVINPQEKLDEIKSLLRADLVFAVHCSEGKSRFARISRRENKVYLHHLQDETPPPNAHILEFNEVYQLVDKTSTLAFLDLGWNNSEQGCLLVRLHPDTARARQFALLCTGLSGPSYANTRLLAIGNQGLPSEYIRGGDYQYNNGTGGASLLPGLRRGGEYWRQQLPGSVMAPGSWGDACSAQFIISTRNPGLAQRDDTIYGQVEDGLHVLKAAIKDTRISEVNVVDCGIVISM